MVRGREKLMMFLIIATLIISEPLVIPSKILKKVITALVGIVMLLAKVLELAAIVVQIAFVHLFTV